MCRLLKKIAWKVRIWTFDKKINVRVSQCRSSKTDIWQLEVLTLESQPQSLRLAPVVDGWVPSPHHSPSLLFLSGPSPLHNDAQPSLTAVHPEGVQKLEKQRTSPVLCRQVGVAVCHGEHHAGSFWGWSHGHLSIDYIWKFTSGFAL